MARQRWIKPEFFTSEALAECSPSARLVFAGLWVFSDDSGIHPASPKRLKMEIFPGDDFTADQMLGFVQELIRVKIVTEYVSPSDGASYWRVTNFVKHQKPDYPSYRYPLEDGCIPEFRRTVGKQSASARRSVAESSESARDVQFSSVECLTDSDTELTIAALSENRDRLASAKDLAAELAARAGYSGTDGAIFAAAANLVGRGLSEADVRDAAEACRVKTPKNPPAYFRRTLADRLAKRGDDLDALLARKDAR